ncbi:MAG: alanine racemase [Gammaproteobacteria bacterium]|nr:alanine racemase [Gammaproteobacteria bacterium]MDH5729322.1 alanine racemase [Gammaproteobacteria bacterium]
MTQAAEATIDLSALRHNLQVVKKHAPQAKIMAVIKANAYGHGMMSVAKALEQADAFAVAHIEEAIQLREKHKQKPIVLLHGFANESELKRASALSLQCVIHDERQLSLLQAFSQKINLWLKLDTGMNRLGFSPNTIMQAYGLLKEDHKVLGLFSHFANADQVDAKSNQQQLKLFHDTSLGPGLWRSMANSAAILTQAHSHYDWVRPGIMLYGASPFSDKSAQSLGLKPVMSLSSQVIAVKDLAKGQAVGYGSRWKAKENTRIAVIGLGYGDGYPRHAADGTPVVINGESFTLAGRVSMDMICVEIGSNASVNVGDSAILWGQGGPAINTVAQFAETIPYELSCRLTSRVVFKEVDNG